MTRSGMGLATLLIVMGLLQTGCNSTAADQHVGGTAWPGDLGNDNADRHVVTIVIALSSVVPGGIIGHAGIAVDQQYWDFGPKRTDRFQRLQAFDSPAGPWWDDPDQRGQTDRTLEQVLKDLPNKLHPQGSLVTLIRIQVTPKQAQQITAFWDDTYARMRNEEDRYTLRRRQCASMIAWSLDDALRTQAAPEQSDRLPRNMRWVTPTRLYEALQSSLQHTAGPRLGQPADITRWQLCADGLEPWQRPAVWDAIGMPEMPRTRLAFERIKHLPGDILQ